LTFVRKTDKISIIMLKQKVTIMLTGLMFFSSISGFFTVICYGSDGHIAVEPLVHNHCECPEPDKSSHQKDSSEHCAGFSSDHGHCKDTPAMSSVVISVRKNNKLRLVKVFVQGLYQKSVSNHIKSSFSYLLSWDTELSSFFTPLRTVILLA
jgi:hypothetical protein